MTRILGALLATLLLVGLAPGSPASSAEQEVVLPPIGVD